MRILYASSDEGFEKLALNCAKPVASPGPLATGKAFRYGRIAVGACCRDWLFGTTVCRLDGWRNRCPSYEKKKNDLSFNNGPPSTPPKLFSRSAGFARPLKLTNQSRASSTSFRKYSKSV